MTLAIPTIHSNGSGRADLIDGYMVAIDALADAILAVQRTGPNGRDYYVQGGAAILTAQAQHRSRLERLGSVIAELREIAESID